LTKDERFNQLPFVTGPPFLKFYAGVPLITKRGIPIGSLFIVDSHVRTDLSELDIHFMGTMAITIMRHLEMAREVVEHQRGMKMSRGLASFVEGRSELVETEVNQEPEAGTEGNKVAGNFETETGITRSKSKSSSLHGAMQGSIHRSTTPNRASIGSIDRKEREYSSALAKTEEAILASHSRSGSQTSRPGLNESQPNSFADTAQSSPNQDTLEASPGEDLSEASSMRILFARAANLIREAFEVDGGVVFYDAQRGFGDTHLPQKPGSSANTSHEESHTSGDDLQSSGEQPEYFDHDEENNSQQASSGSVRRDSLGLGEGLFTRSSTESKRPVEVLGFSTADGSSIHGDECPGPQSFIPFDEKSLHTLLRRYPRGKLWTFDSDGAVSSSSEEEPIKTGYNDPALNDKDVQRRRRRSARAKSDAKYLSRHFPGLRQLLFVPLWDGSRARWLSGCCAWSTEPTRVLTKQNELAFLTAFGNSVMAECSRIDTEFADQKKSDFIGSISHELRSPLHGVLASAEFLGQEVTTAFSKELVGTIDSCGRTLLDTIVCYLPSSMKSKQQNNMLF
jgi:hypothetical protein